MINLFKIEYQYVVNRIQGSRKSSIKFCLSSTYIPMFFIPLLEDSWQNERGSAGSGGCRLASYTLSHLDTVLHFHIP